MIWRQKEFIEKYEEVRYNTEHDNHSILEAQLPNGRPLLAVINTELLDWDSKASHPWILVIEIKYNGANNAGMPDEGTLGLLDEIDSEVRGELFDFDGYLNIGRQTVDGSRQIYIACKDFRKPSKVAYQIQKNYIDKGLEIDYEIFKDKYWQSFNRFRI